MEYGAIVCPTATVEDGPKEKLAFWYPVSQFSNDCHEILQPLLSSHLATILKNREIPFSISKGRPFDM